ncbi:hypothetical protein [Burkholderia gladioli]|uniref:hypothetical protein n=1 Tax=Burkholderia gladioli TaxID=28095 RepID=UPI001640EEA7|nr:hypothetical protein [Burkholderia gladioli]
MSENTLAAILIGDSHYAAIADAAQKTLAFTPENRGCDLIFFNAWRHALRYPFVIEAEGSAVLNPELVRHIRSIAQDYDEIQIITVLGGGHYLALTMLDNGHPMEVILPGQPDLPLRSDAMLVSVDFAKDIFLQLIKDTFRVLACIRAEFPGVNFAQIESPPANGDNDFIRSHLGDYFEATHSSEQINAISNPAQRYKFWRLQSEMYAEKCDELGIDYMAVPERAVTADGFLPSEYFGQDSTHANAAYGRVILDLIETRLGKKLVAWNCFG